MVGDHDQRVSQVDVVHAVKLAGQSLWLWVHAEHQSASEKFMPLRILHYQCGKLLEYAKLNNCDQLPPIISIIYYQGRKPYEFSVDLYEPQLWVNDYEKPREIKGYKAKVNKKRSTSTANASVFICF